MAEAARTGSDHEMAIMPTLTGAIEHASEVVHAGVSASETVSQPADARGKAKQYTTLTALFAVLLISALNTTIMATAIPTIVHELGSADQFAWIGAAYLLGSTTSSPIWAKLSDIWGRKPILLAAVAFYFFSSILCALSTSMTMLIAGRALQGLGGGGLISIVYIVISDMFSQRERGLYLGLTEVVWVLASGIGPVMGGSFAQHLSWRWNFWIALPVCFFAFVLLIFALDVHNPRTPLLAGLRAIDWAGSVTILGLLIMFLLGLNFGGVVYAWNSPTVICLIVFGLLMGVFFVFSERKLARYPLIPMSLFQSRSNLAIFFIGFAHHFALISVDFYFPLFFQSAYDLSPVKSGLLILPVNLTTAVSGILTGIVIHRSGKYLELIWAGMALMTLGLGLFIYWKADTNLGILIGFQIIAGWGLGLLISPPMVAIQAVAAQKDTATATATYGLFKSIAMVLSVVVGQAIFQNGMDQRHSGLEAIGLPTNVTSLLTGKNAAANVDVVNRIGDPTMARIVRDAFAGALRNVWVLDTAVCTVGLGLSVFIARNKLSSEHVETRTGLEKEPTEAERQQGQ